MSVRLFASMALAVALPALAAGQANRAVPRTGDGRPDLTGIYDANTVTPLERPAQFGNRRALTDEEAATSERNRAARLARALEPSDPNRPAPQVSANPGAYGQVFMSNSDRMVTINGEKRASIIVDPLDGRIPQMTAEGRARDEALGGIIMRPDIVESTIAAIPDPPVRSTDPELRPLSERCLLGFGWSSGTPILPNYMYNNLKQIVQTPTQVMILNEMVHDVRVVRIGGKHLPSHMRKLLGDSIGHWEGDTLVVETTNFTNKTRFRGSSEHLRVVERFKRLDGNSLLYQFTVEDPATWPRPWTGEYTWATTDEKMYEYACHENNYALGGILRGARIEEAEKAASQTGAKP